jgi:hypothetical protein
MSHVKHAEVGVTCHMPALKSLVHILFSSLCVYAAFATTHTAMSLVEILQSFPLTQESECILLSAAGFLRLCT